MPATIIFRDKQYEVKPGMTVRSAIQKIGVPLEAVLATRDGELIMEEEILQEEDVITLIAVISGGD